MHFLILTLVFLIVLSLSSAQSGHFRHAFLSWSKLEGNSVEVTLDSSWRLSFSGYLVERPPAPPVQSSILRPSTGTIAHVNGHTVPLISFSDGSSFAIAVNVSSFSVDQDWFTGALLISPHPVYFPVQQSEKPTS